MAPDQTPPDAWSSLTCILPDCRAELAVVWKLYAPLVHGELEPDADPLAPGDAVAGEWRVECLNGHVILVPGPPGGEDDDPACAVDLCDHDHSDELRTWRRTDVDRLTALLRPAAAPLPPAADPSLRDQVINAMSAHAEACQDTDCAECDRIARHADAALAVIAEHYGQPATEPAEPDPFDHTLTVDAIGLSVGHPDRCTCVAVLREAARLLDAGDLPRTGRYRVGMNDLGDRLLIGDRIDPPDRP